MNKNSFCLFYFSDSVEGENHKIDKNGSTENIDKIVKNVFKDFTVTELTSEQCVYKAILADSLVASDIKKISERLNNIKFRYSDGKVIKGILFTAGIS